MPGLAIAGHVALPDPGPPGAPGLFALADPARIESLLAGAGWAQIALPYGRLAELAPSPVIELNWAVAVAMADGPAAGLDLVAALEASGR